MPLEPLRVVLAIAICAVLLLLGRFVAPGALAATLVAGWIQHGQFRITLLVAAAIVGALARYVQSRPKAATALMAAGAIIGTGFLLFG